MITERVQGIVIGTVIDVNDPERQGRVKVSFPWLDETLQSIWASMVAPFAGDDRGAFFMPEVGDEVAVAFQHGDFAHAFVLGAMWNGAAGAPSPDPRQRMIRSKNGHTIRMIDSTPDGGNLGALILEDAHGNQVVMTNGVMTIKAQTTLIIDAPSIVVRGPGWARPIVPGINPI